MIDQTIWWVLGIGYNKSGIFTFETVVESKLLLAGQSWTRITVFF